MNAESEKSILIAGGSGLVGTALANYFSALGWRVSILGRSKKASNIEYFTWNLKTNTVAPEAFKNQDYIINLTGAGIADKLWTKKRKEEIINSRLSSIRLISKGIKDANCKPKQIIQASATGFYGHRPNEVLTEDSTVGKGFLAEVCSAWEKEATESFSDLKTPLTIVRIGVVLSDKGGFLDKIRNSQKARVNLIFGDGQQILPWIHINDLVRIFHYSISNSLLGVINAVSPEPASLETVQKSIAKHFVGKCLHLKTGNWVIKTILSDFSEIFLSNQNVTPKQTQQAGFSFQFIDINKAINNLH